MKKREVIIEVCEIIAAVFWTLAFLAVIFGWGAIGKLNKLDKLDEISKMTEEIAEHITKTSSNINQ